VRKTGRTAKISFLSIAISSAVLLNAQFPATVAAPDRIMTASKIYHEVSTYFPKLDQARFDADYRAYLSKVTATDDRREFDLESMALLATLHDGHTWFYDSWLDQNYGQPVGFLAFPTGDRWPVRRSQLDSVHVGDVVTAIDGVPISKFFAAQRKYISGSSDRDAELSLFMTPPVFPLKFTATLEDGRNITIDREHDKRNKAPPLQTEGRWIEPGAIAYVKVPTLHGFKIIADAVEFVRQFQNAKTIILDVRGNEGGGSGRPLQDALMDKPFSLWMEHSHLQGGILLRAYQGSVPADTELSAEGGVANPAQADFHFTGRLLLLTDRECTCACEDFVMPFKVTHRAQLIGETTAGTLSSTHRTNFENGMMLNVSGIRYIFPDGSPFEGVGIAPDIAVPTTPEDLMAGRDSVFEKALQLARK
jgi:carboxyl-terminal processing protease